MDLVLGSPPYLDARTYGIGAQRKLDEWVAWMLDVTTEAVRVSRGLVLWVVAGVTRNWCYQPGPEGLLYEWVKRGGIAWRPCYWRRVGIPGSGGKQWLRADVEYVMAFTSERGPIPWADNTANGHKPKWGPGGEMSHRLGNGAKVNQWGRVGSERGAGAKNANGTLKATANGERVQAYIPPPLANPGNVVNVIVGGGLLGSKEAHENEAPYPQALAEWFIRSHCPPGGICLDPFSGSGTTVAAARKLGRVGIGFDLRASQCELGMRRCRETQVAMFG